MTACAPTITRRDSKELYDGMTALREIHSRSERASNDPLAPQAANLARLATAADIAADVLFQVVLIAAVNLSDPHGERTLKRWAKRAS